jgi:ABC-2 type transport system permease protein
MRIIAIAMNTLLDAVRQKFFIFLVIISISFIISSYFLRSLGFGVSELKFIFDFGYGTIFLFGTMLSIVTAALLYFNEIENRTVITLLAKPISRYEFIFGKFAGIGIVLLTFTVVMSALQCYILYWRETALMDMHPDYFNGSRLINYQGLALAAIIQWIQFLLIAAITLFIASFSTTNLFTVILTALIISICQIQYIAQDSWLESDSSFIRMSAWLCGKIFPNFQVFNVSETLFLHSNQLLSVDAYSGIITYGILYTLVFATLAGFIFKNREF